MEKTGDIVNDRIRDRRCPSQRRLEDHLLAVLRPWRPDATRVAELTGHG